MWINALNDLSDEARDVIKNGSAEFRVLSAVPEAGITQPDLMKACGKSGKFGFSKAMQKKWISLDKPSKMVTRVVQPNQVQDELPSQLADLSLCDDKTRADLKKRKLFTPKEITQYNLSQGSEFKGC